MFIYYRNGGSTLKESQILLKFEDKSIIKISGFPFGMKIYNEQTKGKIDFDNRNIINFPAHIDYVGSSFIQGFIASIFEQMDSRDKFLDYIIFKSANEFVEDKIYRDIHMWMD